MPEALGLTCGAFSRVTPPNGLRPGASSEAFAERELLRPACCVGRRRLTEHSTTFQPHDDVLVTCASMGLLDVRLIPIMAKHKDDLHSFPATTLRYAPNKVHLAKMLGTQSATRLL